MRTVGLSNQPSSNPEYHFHSLHFVLAGLPDETIVYPGRDFKGWPQSTIREEKAFNPYLLTEDLADFLQVKARQKPADIRPLTVHRDDPADGPKPKPGEPQPSMEFYLPGERDTSSVDENEDDPKLPSWR